MQGDVVPAQIVGDDEDDIGRAPALGRGVRPALPVHRAAIANRVADVLHQAGQIDEIAVKGPEAGQGERCKYGGRGQSHPAETVVQHADISPRIRLASSGELFNIHL